MNRDRINTHHLPDDRAAVVLGCMEEPCISRARLALNTWALYRRAGCGIRESFRNSMRAYRSHT